MNITDYLQDATSELLQEAYDSGEIQTTEDATSFVSNNIAKIYAYAESKALQSLNRIN